MQGSTIINCRQHVGLQKLSVLAGITHSFLGPNKNYKFIQDDTTGESALVCSCFRTFESLELTCAVGQLVYETIQAHHRIYHTGSGCLLFLAGAWSHAALECLQKGISVPHIISAMSEGMDICLDACRKSGVLIERLGVEQSANRTAASHLSKKPTVEAPRASFHLRGTANIGHKTQRKMKLSRHFYDVKSEDTSTLLQPEELKRPDIAHIAEGLSHGSVDAMNLVVKASRLQSKKNQEVVSSSTFDVTKVVTCVLPGLPEDRACVLPGCIVLLSAEQASVVHHLKEQHLKVALINGDLADSYRHLGFNRPAGIKSVSNQSDLSSSGKEEEWMEKIVTLLLRLRVNLILVSGLVGEKVTLRCCRHQILVVEKVMVSVLKAFADATGAVPVTYATQLSKHCVGIGVKAEIWRDLSSHNGKLSTAVNISTGGGSDLVTAVLTSCVHGKLQALEDTFWACAYRLDHALRDRVLLPGAGATEMICIHHLLKQAEHHVRSHTERKGVHQTKAGTPPNPYRGAVFHLMADGLIDYISTVLVNSGGFSKVRARTVVRQQLQDYKSEDIVEKFSQLLSESEQDAISPPMKSSDAPAGRIYDNLTVKQEAWRKALDLVLLVLQTDAEVITGTDHKTERAQENLMLL